MMCNKIRYFNVVSSPSEKRFFRTKNTITTKMGNFNDL